MKQQEEKYKISKTFYNRYFELNAINRLGNELFRFMNFKEGKFINPMKKDEYIKQYDNSMFFKMQRLLCFNASF